MTDRLKALLVVLEQPIREDDAEPLIEAIKQLRGVAEVVPSVSNLDDESNRMMVRSEFRKKLWDVLR